MRSFLPLVALALLPGFALAQTPPVLAPRTLGTGPGTVAAGNDSRIAGAAAAVAAETTRAQTAEAAAQTAAQVGAAITTALSGLADGVTLTFNPATGKLSIVGQAPTPATSVPAAPLFLMGDGTTLTLAQVQGLLGTAAQTATLLTATTAGSPGTFTGYEGPNAVDGNLLTDWSSTMPAYLNLSLPASHTITSVVVTDRTTSGSGIPQGSYGGDTSNFTTSFTLQAYTDGTFTTATGPLLTFNKTAPSAPSSPSDFAYTATTSGLTGQYFRYTVVSNTGGSAPGLADIKFYGN